MTKKTKTKVKRKPTKPRKRAASRRARDPGPPPEREVRDQLAKARAGLEAGRTLDDLLADMQLLVAIGLLHPRTPEHVASLLRHGECNAAHMAREHREQARSTADGDQPRRTTVVTVDDYELLGVAHGASKDAIEAAHRRAILACHPDRFEAVSPAIQRAMTELAAKINGARARLLSE